MIIHNPILTGSLQLNGTNLSTGNIVTTGSNTFVGNQVVSGSLNLSGSITATGMLTAQTLVVQTVTSSVVYSSGSNVFGNVISNTHQFTGSVSVSGSGAFVGALSGTSATFSGTGYFGSDVFTYVNGGIFFNGGGSYGSGIFQQSGGTLALQTGTTPRLTIASTGAATFSSSVNVGGATIGSRFNIKGGNSNSQLEFDNFGSGVNYILSYDRVSSAYKDVVLITNSSNNTIYASTSGNVGIGTSSPNESLTIAGLNGNIRIYGRNGVAENQIASNVYYNGSAWVRDNASYGAAVVNISTLGLITFNTTAATSGYPDERMRITSGGARQYKQGLYYGKSEVLIIGSNFDNPTATILSITNTQTYYTVMIKVTVIQNGVSGSSTNYSIRSVGYAQYTTHANGSAVTYAGSMTAEAQINSGAVGTLSWSGNNLQYTANRVTNYDQYIIIIEYGSNSNVNGSPSLITQ